MSIINEYTKKGLPGDLPVHNSILESYNKLVKKMPKEQAIETLRTYICSPISGNYYSDWRRLATAETRRGATKEQLREAYEKHFYDTSVCCHPGCNEKVPFDMIATGACCLDHAPQCATKRKLVQEQLKQAGEGYKCLVCGKCFPKKESVARHLRGTHKFDDDMLEQYYRENVMTPEDNHGFCKWCGKPTKFKSIVHGYCNFCYNTDCNVRWYNEHSDRHVTAGKSMSKTCQTNKDTLPTQVGYWLKQGLSEKEAQEIIKKRQAVNSVESIMRKKGCSLEEARLERREITRKWLASRVTGLNWSKISQELFWGIWEHIKDEFAPTDVFFATFKEGSLDESTNREYKLITARGYRLADFYIKSLDMSIEFDGAFFHGKKGYRDDDFDRKRDVEIMEAHPEHFIWHVGEMDFRNNKETIIRQCVNLIRKIAVLSKNA